jgi:hypothetical protein
MSLQKKSIKDIFTSWDNIFNNSGLSRGFFFNNYSTISIIKELYCLGMGFGYWFIICSATPYIWFNL